MLVPFLLATWACSVPASSIWVPTPAPGPGDSFSDIGPAGAAPVPFTEQYTLACDSAGMPGGYSQIPADDPDLQSLATAVQAAWSNQTGNTELGCSRDAVTSVRVIDACSQVVAGMNYALIVQIRLRCTQANNAVEVDNVLVAAKVYQPPAAVDPQVTYVHEFRVQRIRE